MHHVRRLFPRLAMRHKVARVQGEVVGAELLDRLERRRDQRPRRIASLIAPVRGGQRHILCGHMRLVARDVVCGRVERVAVAAVLVRAPGLGADRIASVEVDV